MPPAPLTEDEPSSIRRLPPAYPPPGELEPQQRGSRGKKAAVLIILLLVVGAAIWRIVVNRRGQAEQAAKMNAANMDRAVPVTVAAVQQRSMPIYLTGLGSVTAFYTDTIKSRVDGQLMSVNFREGQDVKAGDLLAVIDPRPYQAVLEQAQGQLAKDQASLNNAKAEADRYAALFKAGVVSKETLDLQQSNNGQFEGAIKADDAAIDAAKVNLAYTRITSPIDGRVGLRLVDPGNIVHATDTTGLLVVTQLHPITVVFTLPEDQLPQVIQLLRKGRTLAVQAYDRSDTQLLDTGKLLTIDNQIDPTTGTDKLKAVFQNPNDVLFPNQFVNIRLVMQQRNDAIVIPVAALQHGSQGDFVYVVNPDKTVSVQTIKVGITEGQELLVDSGLSAGQRIVIDGQEKLRPGSSVVPQMSQGGPGSSTGNSSKSPVATRGNLATPVEPANGSPSTASQTDGNYAPPGSGPASLPARSSGASPTPVSRPEGGSRGHRR